MKGLGNHLLACAFYLLIQLFQKPLPAELKVQTSKRQE